MKVIQKLADEWDDEEDGLEETLNEEIPKLNQVKNIYFVIYLTSTTQKKCLVYQKTFLSHLNKIVFLTYFQAFLNAYFLDLVKSTWYQNSLLTAKKIKGGGGEFCNIDVIRDF